MSPQPQRLIVLQECIKSFVVAAFGSKHESLLIYLGLEIVKVKKIKKKRRKKRRPLRDGLNSHSSLSSNKDLEL